MLQVLKNTGWTPNLEKCDLTHTCETVFVGFKVSTDGSNGPWIKVWILCNQVNITARCLACVAGQCVMMSKAIVSGKLLLRNVYRLIASRTSWESLITLDQPAMKDLHQWMSALKSWNGAPLHCKPVNLQIKTDASSIGWGSWMLFGNSEIHAAGW